MNSYPLRLAGYGLLSIAAIDLIGRGAFTAAWLMTAPGRLEFANRLILFAPWLLLSLALIFLQGNIARRGHEQMPLLFLHRLLLPLLVGYLLLVPLMIRDAIGYNAVVLGQINDQVMVYRNGSRQLLEQVRPLTTSLAVAQVLQRYPNISVAFNPADSAEVLKRKLATALSNGQARLQTRLDDRRRSRLEGLFQRTIVASSAALVTAAVLAALRRQNLQAIKASGHRLGSFFQGDVLPEAPSQLGQKGLLGGIAFRREPRREPRRTSRREARDGAFSEEWMVPDETESPLGSKGDR